MMEFTIKKLFSKTIPLRESVVNAAIKNGNGLLVVLGADKWVLTNEHLQRPIRFIVSDKFTDTPVKILYFSIPKEPPPQLSLL